MSKPLKMAAVLGLLSMVLGIIASPTMALDTVMFTGTAQVCAESPNTPKPQAAGCPAAEPNGLYAPGGDVIHRGFATDPSKYMDRHGNWIFESNTCSKISLVAGDTGPVPCQIQALGLLGPVMGVGAACGVSNGHSGMGVYVAANGTDLDLTNIGWVASAGGTLPITADYTGFGKSSKSTNGTLAGVAQWQGGFPCVKSDVTGNSGAAQFQLIAVWQFLELDGGPGGNSAPAVPTLVSPTAGHVFPSSDPQSFTVQTTDPDGDAYTAQIAVDGMSGTPQRLMVAGPAASGSSVTAEPNPRLGPGTYWWRARACDGSGACSDWSAPREVGVAMAGGVVTSDDCQTTVIDGWFGEAYLRVGVGSDGPQTSWVCLRVDHGGELNGGGKLVVTAASPLGLATVTTSAGCPRPPGTALLEGQVGDPSDPVGPFTYLADTTTQGSAHAVCVKVTESGTPLVDLGIVVDSSGGGQPDAQFLPDAPGNHATAPLPPTAARPSSDCQLAGVGALRLVNATIDGAHAWLYGHSGASSTRLCARVETATSSGGGRLTVLHGSAGAPPLDVISGAPEPDDPASPCTANVFTNNAPALKLRRSATDADPLAVCLGVSGVNVWALLDPSPNGTPPDATWTPDP